jgi:hypothetical protein
MSPERNADIRHVSRENIRRDPPRLVARGGQVTAARRLVSIFEMMRAVQGDNQLQQ